MEIDRSDGFDMGDLSQGHQVGIRVDSDGSSNEDVGRIILVFEVPVGTTVIESPIQSGVRLIKDGLA